LKVFPGALPLPYLLVGFVSSGSYSYPYLSSLSQHDLINAIRWKRNKGRAQSKPTHAKGIRSRLGTGQRPHFKVVYFLKACSLLSPGQKCESKKGMVEILSFSLELALRLSD